MQRKDLPGGDDGVPQADLHVVAARRQDSQVSAEPKEKYEKLLHNINRCIH